MIDISYRHCPYELITGPLLLPWIWCFYAVKIFTLDVYATCYLKCGLIKLSYLSGNLQFLAPGESPLKWCEDVPQLRVCFWTICSGFLGPFFKKSDTSRNFESVYNDLWYKSATKIEIISTSTSFQFTSIIRLAPVNDVNEVQVHQFHSNDIRIFCLHFGYFSSGFFGQKWVVLWHVPVNLKCVSHAMRVGFMVQTVRFLFKISKIPDKKRREAPMISNICLIFYSFFPILSNWYSIVSGIKFPPSILQTLR